ncbi:MAG: hypothetical protein WA188_11150, partial [Terriglobales bacterium]
MEAAGDGSRLRRAASLSAAMQVGARHPRSVISFPFVKQIPRNSRQGGVLGLSFADIHAHLPHRGGLLRVHAGLQIGFLQEVTPPRQAIGSALSTLEVLNRYLGFAATFDYGHDTAGLVGPQVVSNDGKRCCEFVSHQKPFALDARTFGNDRVWQHEDSWKGITYNHYGLRLPQSQSVKLPSWAWAISSGLRSR